MLLILRLTVEEASDYLPALADVLHDCVEGGASVSFMWPFSKADALDFFRLVVDEVRKHKRILLAAFWNDSLVGTLQIITAMPPNQKHRADLAKLLVHRSARGHGIGRSLMQEAERICQLEGKTLLVLDTVVDSPTDALYTSMGWTKAGIIPDYAKFPDGRWCATAIFWKKL